ncbi:MULTISPECIES: KTSC domain-containing protein [unclassified Acinetobacter]|uniref:KTSC domain-containing protein n=1 Tax=unclassified Acinetobacter TaxID=196816 RepID=UPI0029345D5A|nr:MULTISPECIES: KTSC domain-containing protein [unclassified Acinetobacter]WOE32032.1 KTSC domain-containing protein [Acinetobacter sp. SAAs470]WOE37500.1 KTSC domain-containing protein [Acinetobacter sp. SAAs474]
MGITNVVTFWNYNTTSKYLKIFYNDGTADLFHPVPQVIFDHLVRSQDKRHFIKKNLEYNLLFTRISLQ